MVRVFVQKRGIFIKKIQNTIRLDIIRPSLLDNLTFDLRETMLKPTETSKKSQIF